jgi:hypothetical protein
MCHLLFLVIMKIMIIQQKKLMIHLFGGVKYIAILYQAILVLFIGMFDLHPIVCNFLFCSTI